MTDLKNTLDPLLSTHASIGYIGRDSASFSDTTRVWNVGRNKRCTPLAVLQPQSPQDVAALVRFLHDQGLPFSVRTGGHNIEGKAIQNDALLIDLRALDAVHIGPDRKSATVGGGILQGKLGETLWKEGLITPTGSIPDVGYILGAKVVKADGTVVDTDEDPELLKGIKGAGGVFGVIVEVRVKVYEAKHLLSGVIMFESSDIKKTFVDFNAAFQALQNEGIPDALAVQQIAINAPPGRLFGTIVVWTGDDLDEGKRWADRIAQLGIAIMNTVAPTAIPDWFRGNGAMVPTSVYGSSRTANVREITPELAETIGASLETMPADPATMLSVHQLRGPSATATSDSVFAAREPHLMLEMLGCVTAEAMQEEAEKWASDMLASVHGTEAQNLLPGAYVSLHCEGPQTLCAEDRVKKLFGKFADEVVALKEKHDPKNLFAHAVPKLK